jgi:hypothetical protein
MKNEELPTAEQRERLRAIGWSDEKIEAEAQRYRNIRGWTKRTWNRHIKSQEEYAALVEQWRAIKLPERRPLQAVSEPVSA